MLIKKNLKFAFNYASARWTSLLKLLNCVAALCATICMPARHEYPCGAPCL